VPVAYGSPDLLAVLSVVYVCECGKQLSEHGLHAGELPPHWVSIGEDRYLCEHCVPLAADAKQRPTADR
jgi:hypothetical protein